MSKIPVDAALAKRLVALLSDVRTMLPEPKSPAGKEIIADVERERNALIAEIESAAERTPQVGEALKQRATYVRERTSQSRDRVCFVAVVTSKSPTGYMLGVCEKDVAGWFPLAGRAFLLDSWQRARALQDECNETAGIALDDAHRIIASTMRGTR